MSRPGSQLFIHNKCARPGDAWCQFSFSFSKCLERTGWTAQVLVYVIHSFNQYLSSIPCVAKARDLRGRLESSGSSSPHTVW